MLVVTSPVIPIYGERVGLGDVQLGNSGLQVGFDLAGQVQQAHIEISVGVAGAVLQLPLDSIDLNILT